MPELDELLRHILEPRLGHVLQPWPSPLLRAVRLRAEVMHLEPLTYLQRLAAVADEAEITHLVDAATIPHTAFFRHEEQFHYLGRLLRSRSTSNAVPIRMWSAGCATGEEAYSMALCAQGSAIQCMILATDISSANIAHARGGRYDARRTRGLPEARGQDGWDAPESVRRLIRFERASLIEAQPTLGMGPFDVVFCRNVLIYFDRDAATSIIEMLSRHVRPGGALVVAPVEGVLRVPGTRPSGAPLGWFTPGRPPALSSSPPPPTAAAPQYGARDSGAQGPPPRAAHLPTQPTATVGRGAAPTTTRPGASLSLESATRLLSADRYDDAEHAIRAVLNHDARNGEAWFLLGQVLLSRGERTQAEVAFRRAGRHAAERPRDPRSAALMRAAAEQLARCRGG